MHKQSDRVHSFHQPNRLRTLLNMGSVGHYCMYVPCTAPFFHAPTSLLLNHSLINDVQQITGRNGQQWINCTSGSRGTNGGGVHILSVSNSPISGNRRNTTGIGPESYPSNGLYYCSEGQVPHYFISLFLKNSRKWILNVIENLIKSLLSLAEMKVNENGMDKIYSLN